MRRVLVVIALIAIGLVLAPPARAATHQVRVENNLFTPGVLEIAPGDTVVWSAVAAGHTITADDGRFDFHADRPLDVGEQVSWRFDAEEVVRYYCKIHGGPGGQGMAGVLRVGEPPAAPVAAAPVLVVPDDVPTLQAAATGARPGTQVLVRPGTYTEEVVVTVPRLTIRGLGARPEDVVLQGGDTHDVGVRVAASGVRLENLRVAGYRRSGIEIGAVSGSVVRNVELRSNGLYGIDARGPSGMTVRVTSVSGHGVAGIGVRDCQTCGVRIRQAELEGNAAGVVAVNAVGVVIEGSHVRANAVGVVLRDVTGARVTGNTITDNDATDVWVAAVFDEAEPPTGAGVWLRGGRSNVVASNTVSGSTYNVAVTGPEPSLRHRIVRNIVSGATHADLGRDGVSSGVCFGDNRGHDGTAASSDPPVAHLSDCAAPGTAGIPYPMVTANLLAHARALGYPA